jgi:hypothetical protein
VPPGRGFDRQQSQHVLSGRASAVAVGEITWTAINTAWRGEVTCYVEGIDDCEVVLQIDVRPLRPAEPTVVLLLNRSFCRRVDVNGAHRGSRWTHVQGRDSSEEPDRMLPDPPEWFPAVPFGPEAPAWVYHQVFLGAARLFGINVDGVQWVDPPEEVPHER